MNAQSKIDVSWFPSKAISIIKGLALVIGISLSACGGGGGGGEVPAPAPAPAPAPELDVSPTTIEISATVGEDPAEGEFTVRNSGGGTLSFSVSTPSGNLTLSPESGTLSANASAAVRVSYNCESEGTQNATVEVTAGQQMADVSVTAECQPAPPPPPPEFEYFDRPPLPDGASVATPWHTTNVLMELEGVENDFESFCTTFRIEGETSDDVNLYISPLNGHLNGLRYYAGIQTSIDGNTPEGATVHRGRGAIFSRWQERDTDAIMRGTGGLIESSGHEGDFISVRNDFAWDEGRYRLCLVQSEEMEGDPLPANYTAEDIAFAWGKYVHTWVRMEATDLDTDQTTFVGALAVPGTTLALTSQNGLLTEMYGEPNPFPAERVPDITIILEQFSINGRALPYNRVGAQSNPKPGREDSPKMTRVRYDTTEQEIRIEQGRFTGRFGVFYTDVEPSRPAVESASLVSIDGEGYIVALRDGQSISQDELPSENLNFRAEPVYADQVASMRLELSGSVSMSRLTNDAPYRLSGGTQGLSLPLGNYRFTATPYAQADGQGEQGASFDAEFTVTAAAQNAAFKNPQLLAHIEAILDTPLTGSNLARELGNLRRLNVTEGGVSDLEGLQYAKNLRVLELPGNRIKDIAALSGLGQLIELDLSGNRIRDIGPLRGRTELRRLNMRDNAITDIGPLAGLAALEHVDLSGNSIDRLEPLAGLTALRHLELARNDLRDLAPLAGLIALRELNADGNAVVDLTSLAGLTQLRHLAVSGNRIEDLSTLAGLQNLKSLKANDNRITRLDPLIALRALERLELNANRINDVGPLASLSELSLLRIRQNRIEDFSPLYGLINDDLEIVGMSDQLRADRPAAYHP